MEVPRVERVRDPLGRERQQLVALPERRREQVDERDERDRREDGQHRVRADALAEAEDAVAAGGARVVGVRLGDLYDRARGCHQASLALFLALLLNRYRKGSNFFKLALYVPLLAPAVLVGLIWQFVTNYDFGLINVAFVHLGIGRLNIFGNGTTALLAIVGAEVWRGLGFWTLYFLASLQNIPEELLDAARVDGASGFRRFRRVTVPLLRPMLLFAVVIAIIANFQVFDTVYVLTQGGPYQSTSTIVWFIWKRLFQFQQTGQGYAAAVLLLAIILVLNAVSFWLLGSRRRRVREA